MNDDGEDSEDEDCENFQTMLHGDESARMCILNHPVRSVSMSSNSDRESQDTVEDRAQISRKRPGERNTRSGSCTDIFERIAHAQITRHKHASEAANQPPAKRIKLEETSEPVSLNPVATGQFLAQDKTQGGPVDPKVRSFFKTQKYANPPIMNALDASGFTCYELLTMEGQDKKAIMERFEVILRNYRWLPAQIETLSYVVSCASVSEWNELKNGTPSEALELVSQ